MKNANYEIIKETPEYVVIKDLGPWDKFPTVTNKAQEVVESLFSTLKGRKLFYYDSNNNCAEIKIKDGEFSGFSFGCPF